MRESLLTKQTRKIFIRNNRGKVSFMWTPDWNYWSLGHFYPAESSKREDGNLKVTMEIFLSSVFGNIKVDILEEVEVYS